ncbi:MAG: hypothetical protein NT129_04990 [Candidatus Aenigmarchaeota archaeon]|nr:hypothetical protein [Candidatus Aenigmarchaeota archaeon]
MNGRLVYGWRRHSRSTRDFYPTEGGNCYCPECCGNSLPLNHNGGSRRPTYSGENIPISIFLENQHKIPDLTTYKS